MGGSDGATSVDGDGDFSGGVAIHVAGGRKGLVVIPLINALEDNLVTGIGFAPWSGVSMLVDDERPSFRLCKTF